MIDKGIVWTFVGMPPLLRVFANIYHYKDAATLYLQVTILYVLQSIKNTKRKEGED
jgi:hypothetical protein